MSTRQATIDAATRHQVFLQRYAGGQSREAVQTLNRLRRTIMARLAQESSQIQAGRLSIILEDINEILRVGFADIASGVRIGAQNLSITEARFSVDLFERTSSASFAMPSDAALLSAVDNVPMSAPPGLSSISVDDALRQYGTNSASQIAQAIRDGVVLGDATPVIANRLSTMMHTLKARQLDALVRTATNHASSVARSVTYKQNSELLDGYQWVATLDSRTTMICGSRDGKIFQEGSGPMPPAHWNCRSTTIPIIKKEFDLGAKAKGARPSRGATGAKVVSGQKTYGGWLKGQPKEFVDEALGVQRSTLFRSGRLPIDRFVDPTGRVYTLQQLQQMNPFVFQDL